MGDPFLRCGTFHPHEVDVTVHERAPSRELTIHDRVAGNGLEKAALMELGIIARSPSSDGRLAHGIEDQYGYAASLVSGFSSG